MLDLKRAQGIKVSFMTKSDTNNLQLSPAQMAEQTGVSIDTLRYYEREGLLQSVVRNASGHRRYSKDDVLWVEVLRCLRATGMTMEQLRNYCDLGAQGDHTQPARLELLLEHKKIVLEQIDAMQQSLVLVDHKIEFYTDALDKENK